MATLITSAMILVFGGLTLWLSDERYLKLQSTLISSLFSVILFAGVIFRWPLLRGMLGHAWPMTEAGWRALTLRLAIFFAAMAALNEAISRTQSTELWVDWNVFGQTIVTLAVLAAQWPLLNRHLDKASADARRELKSRV
jgi:intracellular septation protein